MKTPIFCILLSICIPAYSAQASDFYDNLAWTPVAPAIQALPSVAPAPLSADTFRQFFRQSPMPEFRDLVKACGHPAEEWENDLASPALQGAPPRPPIYHAGHFFRYLLPDGSHVYVWTANGDGPVMRADAISNSGHVAPLFLRPL